MTLVRNRSIPALMKAAGLDFARVDVEHTSLTIADMAVLARVIDFPMAVRPPKAHREPITRRFDVVA